MSKHEHIWWVYSSAIMTRQLMVYCSGCNKVGTVDDPTEHEWKISYDAPSRNYRWFEEGRVKVIKGKKKKK